VALYNGVFRKCVIILLQGTPNNNTACADGVKTTVPYVELSPFS